MCVSGTVTLATVTSQCRLVKQAQSVPNSKITNFSSSSVVISIYWPCIICVHLCVWCPQKAGLCVCVYCVCVVCVSLCVVCIVSIMHGVCIVFVWCVCLCMVFCVVCVCGVSAFVIMYTSWSSFFLFAAIGPGGKRRYLLPGSLPTEYMPVKSIVTAKPPPRKEPVSHFVN